jgi:dinuclear metal center YbgI/SA1388 family protein
MRTIDTPNFMQDADVSDLKQGHVSRAELARHLSRHLETHRFKDVAPNGLQVEGADTIRHIVTGVTANQVLIDAAIAAGADTLIVHHGLFWKGDDPCVVGFHRARIARLVQHNINLFAYHLPLDAHAELGNNVQMAKKLGLTVTGSTGEANLTLLGHLGNGIAVKSVLLAAFVARHYGSRVALYASSSQPIRTIAWCTGAGGGFLRDAIAAGAHAFITGEISEHHIHLARESNVTLIAAGHHATERGGVATLGGYIAHRYGVRQQFIDVDSPL